MEKSLHQLGLIFVSNIQNAGFLQTPNNEVVADYGNLIDFHTMIVHLTNPE
jgi:hypothetical protein